MLKEEAAATLQLALPHEIVMNNVLPFLVSPSHTRLKGRTKKWKKEKKCRMRIDRQRSKAVMVKSMLPMAMLGHLSIISSPAK